MASDIAAPQKDGPELQQAKSYRQILHSSAIIGGASVANIGFGLLRTKVAALLLGPAGIGYIALLQNLMSIAAVLAGAGVGSSATRQIASERVAHGAAGEARVRRAVFLLTALLALVGSLGMWAVRNQVAAALLNDVRLAPEVGWLSVGVGLTIVASSQVALLTGLRRIKDVALVSVFAGALSAVISIGAIAVWGSGGIIPFVLAVPIAGSLVGAVFALRVLGPTGRAPPYKSVIVSIRHLVGLGSTFMFAMVIGTVAQLAVRSMIADRAGLASLGQFQAAWIISTTYMTLVLQAMSADYYPRLSEVIEDADVARRVVGEQLEVALILAAPVLLLIIGAAPLVLEILYSSSFREAAIILRWQVLGDILKVASWPIGFVFLAGGRGKLYVAIEAIAWTIFVGATWVLLPTLGVEAAGVACLLMYVVYLPLAAAGAKRTIGFRLSTEVRTPMLLLLVAASITFASALLAELAAMAVGFVSAAAFGLYAVRKLRRLMMFRMGPSRRPA